MGTEPRLGLRYRRLKTHPPARALSFRCSVDRTAISDSTYSCALHLSSVPFYFGSQSLSNGETWRPPLSDPRLNLFRIFSSQQVFSCFLGPGFRATVLQLGLGF